jgi:hypothetical protein
MPYKLLCPAIMSQEVMQLYSHNLFIDGDSAG